MNDSETGIVKWFDSTKGYGFIERDKGGDVFVHYSDIKGVGYRSLYDGQHVEFTVAEGVKGLKAEDVSAVNEYE